MQYKVLADSALCSDLILLKRKFLWRDVEFWSYWAIPSSGDGLKRKNKKILTIFKKMNIFFEYSLLCNYLKYNEIQISKKVIYKVMRLNWKDHPVLQMVFFKIYYALIITNLAKSLLNPYQRLGDGFSLMCYTIIINTGYRYISSV